MQLGHTSRQFLQPPESHFQCPPGLKHPELPSGFKLLDGAGKPEIGCNGATCFGMFLTDIELEPGEAVRGGGMPEPTVRSTLEVLGGVTGPRVLGTGMVGTATDEIPTGGRVEEALLSKGFGLPAATEPQLVGTEGGAARQGETKSPKRARAAAEKYVVGSLDGFATLALDITFMVVPKPLDVLNPLWILSNPWMLSSWVLGQGF